VIITTILMACGAGRTVDEDELRPPTLASEESPRSFPVSFQGCERLPGDLERSALPATAPAIEPGLR
jgi:hypothetical protein